MVTSWLSTYSADPGLFFPLPGRRAERPASVSGRAPVKFLWPLLLLALVCPGVAAETSRFQRTVLALQQAEPPLRQRFANIALLELTEIYLAEADLARNEAQTSEQAAKLRAWSRAVEQYANQLVLVMDDVAFGLPVELRSNEREVPAVSVAGRTVMLAHPRIEQQPAYEQAVLGQFCTGTTCAELTASAGEQLPIPVSRNIVTARWGFSTGGPVCSHRNLELQFSSAGDLTLQRALCQQLMQEVEMLAMELAWQRRHGVKVDWQGLQIRPTPQRPEHLVLLNDAGDSLLLTIPLLYGTPGLLTRVVPWLQQRHQREGPQPLSLDSSALGWE